MAFLLLCHSYVINAFVTTAHLTLFFDTFKLRIKVSRFLENVFLITLEMHCLLVHSNYVWKLDTLSLRAGSLFLGYFFVVRLYNILK